MPHRLLAWTLAAALLVPVASARAQLLSTDARRIGMGGVSLDRGGDLRRYNAAYAVVPPRAQTGRHPKLTIPIPLGLFQVLDDSAAFDYDSAYWNPIRTLNYILQLPLHLEVKRAPTPTSDVEVSIGKNELILDLNEAQVLIPSDAFGIGASSRLLEPGMRVRGFHVGVMAWLQYEVGFRVGDSLRAFLKEAVPAQPDARYSMLGDAILQAGFAPTVGYAGRVVGDSAEGLYVGAALRYYFGTAYGRVDGDIGFRTENPIFGADTLAADIRALQQYSRFGRSPGRGIGGDIGIVWLSGPLELGVGVNDIGAKLTWSNTRRDSVLYDPRRFGDDSVRNVLLADGVESTTELPVSFVANLAYAMGEGTMLGAGVINSGRGTRLQIGAEKWVGLFALRGGVARDQRKRMQFAWGGGVRLGMVGLDLGFWTHTNSFSDKRGITMATSVAIY